MAISKNKKKFAFDTGWAFAGTIIVLLLHFIQKPILARYLGPDGLGMVSMTITIGYFFGVIAFLGMDSALVKFVAEHKENKSKVSSLFSSAFITIMISGIISSVILFFSSDTFASILTLSSLSSLLKIYALALPFTLIHGILISLFMGLREMRYFAFIRIFSAFLTLAFIVVLLTMGFGVKGAIMGTVFATIVAVGVAMVIMKRLVYLTFSNYKKNTKTLVSFGSRMIGANVIGYVYTHISILMIGYFLTSTDVGYYDAATSLSRFFWLIPSAIGIVSYPAISEYWAKNDLQAINKLVDKVTKYSSCALTLAGMGVIFFAKDIIALVFTPEFLPAVLLLGILTIGAVASGILTSLGEIFGGVGRPDLTLKIAATVAIATVILNAALIPPYGIVGAAIATTSARLFWVVIVVYLLRKVLAIKFDSFWYIKLGILVAVSGILFYAFSFLNYYFFSAIIMLIYAIVVVKYFLTKEDREYLVSIIKHIMHGDFMKF